MYIEYGTNQQCKAMAWLIISSSVLLQGFVLAGSFHLFFRGLPPWFQRKSELRSRQNLSKHVAAKWNILWLKPDSKQQAVNEQVTYLVLRLATNHRKPPIQKHLQIY